MECSVRSEHHYKPHACTLQGDFKIQREDGGTFNLWVRHPTRVAGQRGHGPSIGISQRRTYEYFERQAYVRFVEQYLSDHEPSEDEIRITIRRGNLSAQIIVDNRFQRP